MATYTLFPIAPSEREYVLDGPSGNAFVIMKTTTQLISQAARAFGLSGDTIDKLCKEYRDKATAGDYENLLEVTQSYVDFVWIK